MSTTIYCPASNTSVTVKNSGGASLIKWINVSSNTSMQPNTGYFVTQGASRVTMLLPSSPSNGDIVEIRCVVPQTIPAVTGFGVSCLSSQKISIGGLLFALGQGATNDFIGASVSFVYNNSNSTWESLNIIGFFK